MKRINREINIFNLSMMDVISGAMGAFLILVVILSRHYNSEVINTQKILELQKELVEATGSLSDVTELVSGDITDTALIERSLASARRNVERSKAHVQELYGDLKTANATILAQEEEIDYLQDYLDRHKPFFIMTKWECDRVSNVDIYLWNDGKTREQPGKPARPMPAFDPGKRQGDFFSEELEQGLANTTMGVEVWSSSLSDIDREGKLYYRIDHDEETPLTDCAVSSWLVTPEGTSPIERQNLSPSQPWVYVGQLDIDDERRVTFRVANSEERNNEHGRIRAGL